VNGALRLRAKRLNGRTVLTDVFRTPPFVVGAVSYRSDPRVAEVIIQQTSPGLLPGDTQEIEITVAADARLVVRGQAATKLYPCPDGEASRVCARYTVEPDGELVVLPGELIPFRDSDSVQRTEVQVAPGARFITGDFITPGRVAMGECHRYRCLELRLTIQQEEKLVLVDRTVVEPGSRDPRRLGIHGDFACVGSLYFAGYGDLVLEERRQHPDLRWAAGSAGGLTTVRILGRRASDILALRDEFVRNALSQGEPRFP
jgi:urease accessory protein